MAKKVNAKKVVAKTLDNALLKVRSFLLNVSVDRKNDFDRTVDRIRRNISDSRDTSNPFKNKYPVAIATNFKVVSTLLNPIKFEKDDDILDNNRDVVTLSALGRKFHDNIKKLLDPEMEVISQLVESEMASGTYLGETVSAED